MRAVTASAPARVALAGNPSDGYGGRTLSLAIANYSARVDVAEAAQLEILPAAQDRVRFESVSDLVADVEANGYYGGLRLLKASVRRLHEHCAEIGASVGERTFSIHYETDIPRGVGLGGSSAIVTAAVRALADFLGVEIERWRLAQLALSVETQELGIAAGLQDRVAQAFGGLTYMDFDAAIVRRDGHPLYESVDPALLPPLFVAHREAAAEPSEVFHSDLRSRFESGDPGVVEAMSRLGAIAADARSAVLAADHTALAACMEATFEVRRGVATLDPRHVQMIDIARDFAASANYAGSGGAIVGTIPDLSRWEEMQSAFEAAGCEAELVLAAPHALAGVAAVAP